MALLRAAALPADGPPAWLPTHVQVTVVRARGLRCKGGGGGGKAGSSDAFTIIQLGREKYCTSVAEKSGGCPEWKEECAFELPPTEPGAEAALLLTVMHRALVGMDRFLGMARVPLRAAGLQGRAAEERWHKLHSKPGKKEKERGEIQVSIQFTRNNLTASMFDLSMKDKPRSPFGKLKDKMKGKKKYDLESASAIIPSSMGALDMEDDYDVGGKKSKVKGFFLKNKLRKSSLTQSNTSLGSDSTISSASLGMATGGPEVTRSPSRHSSLSTERSVKDFLPSPKLTHKRAFSDDVSQVSPVLEPKAIHSLKPKTDPVSRSSLCINGSHVYSDEPTPRSPVPTPQGSAPLPVPRRPEEGFGFIPIHTDPHEVPWGAGSLERTQQREELRFIPSPPSLVLQEELKVSTKAVTLSNHLGRARMEENSRLENKPTQVATPMVFSAEVTKEKQPEEMRKEEKKTKGGLFHKSDAGSRGQGEKTGASHGPAAVGDDRSKAGGWFGSKEPKDSPQKPSFPSEPHASTEVAESLCSSEDCSPSASLRLKDPERESPAKSVGVPVPETTPPSHADPPPPPDEEPAASPPPLSEWDETFDAFATSRLRPDPKKEDFFASVAAEGMAFIDDPDAASPTERSAEPDPEEGTKGFEKAEPQISSEMPPALLSWTNFSGLDVGANLVSTTQEATVIEDVLSPVSAGSAARRRKSSTPMVWAASLSSGNPGEKEASTLLSADNCAGEERDSNEEETSSVGENGWMTIATETSPDPSESTQSIGQGSTFGQRSFHSEGTFETKSTPHVLPRSTFSSESTAETIPGSSVAAVPPRVLQDMAVGRFPAASDTGKELQDDGGEMFDIRSSVYRLQASMRLEAGEGRVKMGSDAVLAPWAGVRGKEEVMPPPKPPRWFAAACGRGDDEDNASDTTARQRGGEEQQEGEEGLEQPRSHPSGDTTVPAPRTVVHEDAADVEAGGDTSLGEEPPEMNGTDAAEHFETCPSRFSVDELTLSGAARSWSQPALSPVSQLSLSAEPSVAPEQEPCPAELGVSAPDLSPRPDSGLPETFWTALEEQEALGRPHSFPSEPHASTEVAESLCSSEDCSPSASLRLKDPERESPAKSVGVPVPETTPPSHADPPPPPDEEPAASPPPLSEWDETFDAFATSRLRPDPKKEDFFASVAAEGMAFIDDPDAASPTERSAEPDPEEGTKGFEKAEPQISSEMPPALLSWTNFSGLDVGANLVSTTQEATVIEDVLSPVSAGSAARRRKSSTPMVWAASLSSGNPGEKEASTLLSADNCAGEERDSNEEETSSVGENGWMTIATETSPDPSESTQSIGQGSTFGQRSFHSEGTFETKSTPHVLPRSTFSSESTAETIPGSNVAAVPPRVLQDMAVGRFPAASDTGKELQDDGGEMFDIRSSVYRLQASMRLEAGEGRVKMGSDAVLAPWAGVRGKEEVMPPPKPPRWFAAACGRGDDEDNASDTTARQRGGEEQQEGEEGLEQPRSHPSGDTTVPAPRTVVHEDAADVEAGGDTSLGEEPPEMNGTDAAEHFETCPSRFSVDELTLSGAAGSWSQPALSPVSQLSLSAEPSVAPEQEPCPAELGVSAPDLSPRPDSGLPETFWTALEEQEALGRPHSPHPVKPISAAVQEVSSEKKQQNKSSLTTALSNSLEKLKTVTTGSVQPVAPSSHLEKTDPKKDPTALDQSAKYYHLTHDELIQLLLQREKELSKKEEHIQELEDYIDQLLVRIMEQSPTLLQIPLGEAKTK